jgi:pimeloyl-ACP methyl ester carboxylesterase
MEIRMNTRSRWRLGLMAALLLPTAWGPAAAQAPRFTERDVIFRNGAVELRGTLMLPAVKGPHPAVVFLHGSGSATRAGARTYAQEFAGLGVASLFFDKRGSGSSSGSWVTSSLDDLATDALAAVKYLKTQEGIDPERIGFWGVSQAGWVATLAASQSADVAFMILISGGGASPRESELFSYGSAFEQAGLSEAEKADAFAILDLYFGYLATGKGRSQLVERLEAVREGRLSPLAKQLNQVLPSDENRANWSWVATWDPAPSMAKIKCPLLLMFGDRDTDHPTAVAVQKWREGLKRAANDELTLVVFPGAGHGIRMREGHTSAGRPPFADGYTEVMLGWLWRHVIEGKK